MAMFDWHSVPGWLVAMMFGAMVYLAYSIGIKTAEVKFLGVDSRRYSWLRRQQWIKDGSQRMDACDVDRMCDVGQVTAGLSEFAGSKTHNV